MGNTIYINMPLNKDIIMTGRTSVNASGFKPRTATGFEAGQVNSFLQAGNTQASGGGNIAGQAPRLQTVDLDNTATVNPTLSNRVSTQGQLDVLVNTFLRRERQISQRRAQPSRSALFLARQ